MVKANLCRNITLVSWGGERVLALASKLLHGRRPWLLTSHWPCYVWPKLDNQWQEVEYSHPLKDS